MGLFVAGCLLASCQRAASGIACPYGPQDLLPPEQGVIFQIDNQSCSSICRVFLSAPTCDNWGTDLLQGGVVNQGETLTFWVQPGSYDLMIEECTQAGYILEQVDLGEDAAWIYGQEQGQSGEACQASLTVLNQGSAPVCHLWIAGPTSESFGYDWLGESEIPVGGTRTFALPPDSYDLKAEDCAFNLLELELGRPIYDHQAWIIP